ncbi:MAG: hypothetical protein HYU36_10095 [Planctomycetes bacterium]|nr:hypothetical protein [Planctomycetota bacterium]
MPIAADEPVSAEIRLHLGRPMVFVGGRPLSLPAYSPRGWSREGFLRQVPRFFTHRMGAYFLCVPPAKGGDFFATPFWAGDEVRSEPMAETDLSLDEQAEFIQAGQPGAFFIVRFGTYEPKSWRDLHPDQLVVTEEGERLEIPSLASDLYWEKAAEFSAAVVRYCESRPWSRSIIGYAHFHRVEGTHEPLIHHWLTDHSAIMTHRWRAFLKEKYGTADRLREAHGEVDVTFETAGIPRDRLRGPAPEVSRLLYWQPARDNQRLRDYLLLTRDLYHRGFQKLAGALYSATGRHRFFVHDALKQTMLGWSNSGFFDPRVSWPLAYPELMAGSGHMQVAGLFGVPGCDGLCTPHDYQARGMGGVFEPEGIADTAVLRGKLFLCEMDTRTYTGGGGYGEARDDAEFAAITWRNVASAITRGFTPYWMDLSTDWFATESMHRIIGRQVEVLKASADWPHETPPGIAMVLDDSAVLETSGSGNVFNETILWEQKMGLARCGVPYRIYLFEDLERPDFPAHRLFYFPNLYRVDEARLQILHDKVFRDGRVVLWGPGSGISDGQRIGPESAERLTGFQFEFLAVNYPRRTLISNFEHPATRDLAADTIIGGPLAYGPVLYPKGGLSLGLAWTKQGMNESGLSVKTFGRGALGSPERPGPFGPGDYASVFTTAVPIPASLWRGLARFADAHVYCETNDLLMADHSVVALHSLRPGRKSLRLPRPCRITDLESGRVVARRSDRISFEIKAPATRVFRLESRP